MDLRPTAIRTCAILLFWSAVGCAWGPYTPPSAAPSILPERELLQLEEQALQAWSSGRLEDAVAAWRHLIAAAPDRRKYRMGLVRTLIAAGERALARREFEAALAIPAPQSDEAYATLMAQAELLRAEHRHDAAGRSFEAAAAIAGRPRFDGRRTPLPEDRKPMRWRFSTGMIVEHFDHQRALDSQLLYQLRYRFSSRLAIHVLHERHGRPDAVDHVLVAGVAIRPSDSWALRLDAGGAPHAEFRPHTEAAFKLQWLGADRWRPSLGGQLLDYAPGTVRILSPGLRVLAEPLGSLELQYDFGIDPSGAHTHSGSLGFERVLGGRWIPSLTYSRGEDILSARQRAEFERVAIGLSWLAAREWQLRLDYAYEDREAGQVCQSLAVGIGLSF